MLVLVTSQLTGVDGKAFVVGKESNTKSLIRTIKIMAALMVKIMVMMMMTTKMIKVFPVTLLSVVGNRMIYSRNHSFDDGRSLINWGTLGL